ncbi:hypothetical protein, partial [Thiolapillus sp.]|uniref:hypothetical protein n=1 Tax=Thiolapillus sp. TaxID=2017437 RepID=UPI0025CC8EF5
AGAQIGCQRLSRFWGLGCPKIYHEAEDTLDPLAAGTGWPSFLGGNGDRHRQDLRLFAHVVRAEQALRLHQVHRGGAEYCHT